jgi:ATP-dependent RNA helicase MSS116, mitochondrial
MTEIQQKTWKAAIEGQDVLGRSRTGSGKTLAFLIPSLERILRHADRKNIKMLIISPTRELAHQIYDATLKLTSKFAKDKGTPAVHCQVCYGGIPKRQDVAQMERAMPTILTATPGRLLDHLESSSINNVYFHDCIKGVDILVLDEMDRLLDMGFRQDLEAVLKYLAKPSDKRQRQTLLFSATMPPGVSEMIRLFVRRDHAVVDCIQDDDPASHTVNTVDQSHVILPANKLVTGVVQTILHIMKSDQQHKIIVFFPTTSQVAYFSSLFNTGLGRRVLEIHSRISQGTRMNTSDRFRHAKTSVLFTSDVSARGVDYPNVTHVLQVGAASDRETYIHRLGRTGRAGKSGKGILLLMDTEAACLRRDLRDISIPLNSRLQNLLDTEVDSASDFADDMRRLKQAVQPGTKLQKHAEQVYSSLLGYYVQRFKALNVRRPQDAIVEFVNSFASQAGLKELPVIPHNLAKQYGLDRHPALNIRKAWDTGGVSFDVGKRQGGSRSNKGSQGSATKKPEWAGWLR